MFHFNNYVINFLCSSITTIIVNGLQSRNVQLIQYAGWPERAKVPRSTASVLKLLKDVVHLQQQTENAPVIVHCMYGTGFDHTLNGILCLSVYSFVCILLSCLCKIISHATLHKPREAKQTTNELAYVMFFLLYTIVHNILTTLI